MVSSLVKPYRRSRGFHTSISIISFYGDFGISASVLPARVDHHSGPMGPFSSPP